MFYRRTAYRGQSDSVRLRDTTFGKAQGLWCKGGFRFIEKSFLIQFLYFSNVIYAKDVYLYFLIKFAINISKIGNVRVSSRKTLIKSQNKTKKRVFNQIQFRLENFFCEFFWSSSPLKNINSVQLSKMTFLEWGKYLVKKMQR